MTKITEKIRSGKILAGDGAWGTQLQNKGLQPGDCPELWCLERPDDVFAIAKAYVEAGADIIETNSFGGSRIKLAHYGLADRAAEINRAAASLSRKAAGPDRHVIGSIGPTGKILMMGDVSEEELYEAFKEQLVALEQGAAIGGADGCCIETMTALDEALLAVRAAKENTKLEVICTFTFDKTPLNEYRTMMGVSPADMARALIDAGADIIGTNCGNGMEGMAGIVREIRSVDAKIPILVQANAGMPEIADGKTVFPATPEQMAALVPEIIAAGASIIGGCCGTTPAHIAAMAEAGHGRSGQLFRTLSR